MLIITSKLPWKRQPTGPVNINWGHPLANGLVYYAWIGESRVENLCRNGYGIEANRIGVTQGMFDTGKTIIRGTSSSDGVDLGSPAFLQSQAAVTLHVVMRRFAAGTYSGGLWAGTSGNRVSLAVWSDNNVYAGVDNSSNSYVYITGPADNVFVALSSVFNGALTGNSRLVLYKDGTLPAQSYSAAAIPATTSSTIDPNLWVGRIYLAALFAGSCEIANGLIYLRALDSGEIQELNRNPYQMLSPTLGRIYFIPDVGGSQTIAVTTGTETGIGYSLGITQPRTLAITTGNETGLGYALSIIQPRSIAFTAGEETGVGYQLGLAQPRAIGLVDGQETGIGYTLGVTQPRVIGLDTGSETGIGYALGISAGGNLAIDFEAGIETGLGYAFSITQPRNIGFATGTETSIGYALTIAPPGPVLGLAAGMETSVGYALTVIQHGRKYRYPRPTKAINTRHYTGRL
jgi:hypothetical protein